MRTGVNMALSIWDTLPDDYNHTELANNWDAVDQHDHTTGKGKKIPAGGLAANSVTGFELAPNSVTSNHIVDGTIQGVDIADGTIPLSKLSSSIYGLVPLGAILPFFRPDTSFNIPSGWVLAAGQTLAPADHSWGAINVTIPNLTNRFILGANISGTGTGPGSAPAENATGGSHTQNLSHSHTVDPHTHQTTHSHSIPSDGSHSHQFFDSDSGVNRDLYQRAGATSTDSNFQSAYLQTFNMGNQLSARLPMSSAGTHNHSGNTGVTTVTTTSTGVTTNGPNAITSDFRPSFLGLLYIVRVKLV